MIFLDFPFSFLIGFVYFTKTLSTVREYYNTGVAECVFEDDVGITTV